MLPIGLVLLVASSAFAAPSVILNQYENNNGDGSLLGAASAVVDGGDKTVYILNLEEAIKDGSPSGLIRAYGQFVSLLGALSGGRAGDACAEADLINAYSRGKNIRPALANYIRSVVSNIDLIVLRALNPEASRYTVSAASGCPGEGRSYQFEAAWQKVLGLYPNNSALNEQYCIAKRLYASPDVRNNVAAASATAATLPPVVETFARAGADLGRFVKELGSKGAGLKQAARSIQKGLLKSI